MNQALEQSLPACISQPSGNATEGELSITAQGLFPDSFAGFAGHFPDTPVLPAIIQLAAVRHLAERALQKPLLLESCSKAKFRSMISPAQQVSLHLKIVVENDSGRHTFRTKFKIQGAGSETLASGICIYSTA